MKIKQFRTIMLCALSLLASCTQTRKGGEPVNYPETKKCDTVDTYFGVEVADPYRWLEDDYSEETAAWVESQNRLTQSYLSQIPYREKMKQHLKEMLDYPKEGAPFKKGDRYFFYRNNGLQNQSVLYYKSKLDGEAVELLDPNKLSDDGTVALSATAVSDDGRYLGYAISRNGSDWQEIYVKDIETGATLDDHLVWVKFSSIAWKDDGFFYSRFPEPDNELSGVNENGKLYYHKVGTPQSEDILAYEDRTNPNLSFSAGVVKKRYLVIYGSESTSGNSLYYKDLADPKAVFVKLVDDFTDDYAVIDEVDGRFIVMTNHDAPEYKVVSIPVSPYAGKVWEELIPAVKGEVLTGVSHIGGKLIANYIKDARSLVKIFNEKGVFQGSLDNEVIGSISGFAGEPDDTETFYTVTSYTTPATIYRYDVASNKSVLYKTSEIKFNSGDYVTEQKFFTSKDGTRVPMFITHKKGIKMDGKNPALLYGYGGFNISLTPGFSATRVAWLEQGGVYAVVNLRGGGEYGKEWHEAGTKMRKQNVFDDCIAAAEFLISQGYTSSDMLALEGGSNGGLLVGAVVNQRPDLFAVAVPHVGVMDMLRYHKFTIGRYWAVDYGTSEDSKEMFEYLRKYSPLHSIQDGKEYPAILVTTADHDDRVVPAHSFKYAAALQNSHIGDKPHLIRIESNAGHGGGKPLDKTIEEVVDVYSFMFFNMGITPKY
ncbi:MAG: prolyl oligopeptidase family serine peptidase [Bacteroidales bacterium]|nr:prolyl oligopeptidase family serine peptidase [Bacteroidales bacterium]